MAASALPPWLWPGWWLAHRTPALVAVRLLATLLFAVQLAAFPATVDGPGWAGMATALLIDSGAAALCLLPLR